VKQRAERIVEIVPTLIEILDVGNRVFKTVMVASVQRSLSFSHSISLAH